MAGRACRPMVRPCFVAGVASFVFRITAAPLARNTEHPSQGRALPRFARASSVGRPKPFLDRTHAPDVAPRPSVALQCPPALQFRGGGRSRGPRGVVRAVPPFLGG